MSKFRKIIKKIFSLRINLKTIYIMILGISITIDFGNLFINIIAGLERDSKKRKILRAKLRKENLESIYDGYDRRYKNKIAKLRWQYKLNKFFKKPIKPIKVLFPISQNSKWACDSLYRALEANEMFEPIIVITPTIVYDKENLEQVFNDNFEFFQKKGFNVVSGYDFKNNSHISFKNFKPDIIFYQQQYNIPNCQEIYRASKYALCCWVPYSLIIGNYIHDYDLPFQFNMWKIFLDSEINKKRFESLMENNGINCVASGYPKIDPLLENNSSDNKKKMVIYAPHHTFEPQGQRFATFDWNGVEILKFVENHPEIEFVLKPHPRFNEGVIRNNIMSRKELDEYYRRWNSLTNTSIYDKGDYLNLFKNSYAMITDCASFLAEYSITQKPLLHLFSTESQGYNELGDEIIKNYYRITNLDEMRQTFEEVLVKENDYMKEQRLNATNGILRREGGAGNYIKEYIKHAILGGNNEL